MMTSVLDLSNCIPPRPQPNWDVLERKTQNEFRKNKKNDRRHLPLSILVKIRGPPKIVDSYKINVPNASLMDRNKDISAGASCTPLNIIPFKDKNEDSKGKRKGVIVLRPALQQSKQIPGRYFPKPTLTEEQQKLAMNGKDAILVDIGDKNRTDTSISNSSSKDSKSTFLSDSKRRSVRKMNRKLFHNRKTVVEKETEGENLFTFSLRGPADSYDPKCEGQNDYYTVKRIASLSRQVTFPEKSDDFREMLTGTTKTLHHRKLLLSAPAFDQADPPREPTHVSM